MVLPLNPNEVKFTDNGTLLSPRDTGRGSAIRSTGTVGTVAWASGQVRIDGVDFFPLASSPTVIDFCFDQLDRGVVVYRDSSGNGFIYFYDPTLSGYNTLAIGPVSQPAACNDYIFGGVNAVVVYLLGAQVTYRLQADRFSVAYSLPGASLSGIDKFGIHPVTNSLAVLRVP